MHVNEDFEIIKKQNKKTTQKKYDIGITKHNTETIYV